MSVVNMAKNIKKVHPEYVICYKVGNFCNSYGKDAHIISYLFDYKIKDAEPNIAVTGFPKRAIPKIMARLEREKINYMVIDTRNNYDVDEQQDNGNLNRYEEVLKKAHKTISIKRRVNNIAETLIKEMDINKIKRVEEIAYENRKI